MSLCPVCDEVNEHMASKQSLRDIYNMSQMRRSQLICTSHNSCNLRYSVGFSWLQLTQLMPGGPESSKEGKGRVAVCITL